MEKKLNDKYNPQDFEEKLYQEWEEKGYFKPSMDKTKESYCIMMPPPNVTGKLHMGHALDDTIQDILIRFKRMQGYNTLWLPGSDHAAIATEVKVVEKMKKEAGDLAKTDEDVLAVALFPQVAPKFLENKYNKKPKYYNKYK